MKKEDRFKKLNACGPLELGSYEAMAAVLFSLQERLTKIEEYLGDGLAEQGKKTSGQWKDTLTELIDERYRSINV